MTSTVSLLHSHLATRQSLTSLQGNWPYKWEVTGGASTNPCSETYKGVAAGDAPELRGLKAQVDSLKASRGIRLYLDVQYVPNPPPTLPKQTNNQANHTPAPTANTSSGPTATTATCAPKTTPSTAPSPPAPSLLSAPSPVPLTPLVPAARHFMLQLVLRPITLMLRVMRLILIRTS